MFGSRKGEAATLASTLFWGSSFVAIKMGLEHVDPVPFAIIRFLFAALFSTVVFCAVRRRLTSSLLRNRYLYLMGIFNAGGFLLQYLGIDRTTAIKSSLLVNINLIFVMILSHYYLGERATPRKLLSVAGGIFGIFLLVTEGDFDVLHTGTLAGDLIVLMSGFTWAWYIVISRKVMSNGTDIFEVNYILMLLTAAFLLPFGIGASFEVSRTGLYYILYVAFFCTTIPFLLWTYGLKTISATTSSVLATGEVVFATLMGAVILGERLNAYGIAGAAIMGAAITTMSLERKRKQPTRDF